MATTTYASTILADNPQAYYRLNETGGTLLAQDSSGYGNTATLSGVTSYGQPGAITGDSDTCLLFSAGGSLSLPVSITPTIWGAVTLEFWINLGDGSGWNYVAQVVTTSGTTTYLNGIVESDTKSALVFIGQGLEFAGSFTTSAFLDEVGIYAGDLGAASILTHFQVGQGIFSAGVTTLFVEDTSHPAGRGYNTSTFGIGIYQPILNGTTVGSSFIGPGGPIFQLRYPYSGVYGGTYGFVMNTILRQPKVYQYVPAPSIGLDGTGIPVIRGYPSMMWSYSSLRPDYWYYLKNLYFLSGCNQAGYQYLVLLQYPDPTSPDAPPLQNLAYWDPPQHSFRDVGSFMGVTLTFKYVGAAQLQSNIQVIQATA